MEISEYFKKFRDSGTGLCYNTFMKKGIHRPELIKVEEAQMKRQILCTAFAAALTLTLAVPAAAEENKIGDVVGHTYYTDIAAQINGHPLRSYNIGGETAVVAEDLREYGFSVVWDGEARTLTVERDLEGEVTGDYQPQGQTQTVGAQAGDIYYTDIKTYVQGERVTSYAIGGETAIRFSELERTGTLAWEEEERTASLTLAEDPMEFALARMEAERTSGSAEQYAGPYGTAVCFVNGGLPHGTGSFLDYVAANGAVTSITALMPHAGFGAEYYLSPSEIQFDETGRYLTFQTPIKEAIGYGGLGVGDITVDYGDCLCTFDTQIKQLTWEPTDQTSDPMEAVLKQLEENIEAYQEKGAVDSSYVRYPNGQGVLFVCHNSYIPNGGLTRMIQVYSTGRILNVTDLLPGDAASYLRPREIQSDETGRYMTFITPIQEIIDYDTGAVREYGDCQCTFDVEAGTLAWEPLAS